MKLQIRPLPSRSGARDLLGRLGLPYRAPDDLVAAVNVAIVLGQPLLLTGEPGCGKTDFAFAVARYMAGNDPTWQSNDPNVGLLECYVRSDTQARDLLYGYDAIRRFADAHHGRPEEKLSAADPRNYIDLEPLGRALAEAADGSRRVVLVDEIDKAPRDLPNDLLRELDQGCFEIKEIPLGLGPVPRGLRRVMGLRGRRPTSAVDKPLVIITTNEERQLPPAFLRRCIFHRVRFPDADALDAILADRPGAENQPVELRRAVVDVFLALRQIGELNKLPTTSELINWFDALLSGMLAPMGGLGLVWRYADGLRRADSPPSKVRQQMPWRDLPGIGCLLKTDDDWRVAQGR